MRVAKNLTLDIEVVKKLNEYTKDRNIIASRLVEELLKEKFAKDGGNKNED